MNGSRFDAIISAAGECLSYADIGCDHGKISMLLAEKFPQAAVFATDISAPSLKKAQSAGAKYKNITFLCGNGFTVLPYKPECAVIAGMGGEAIAGIIHNPFAQTRLVLQPMKDSEILYRALCENGFFIENVVIVREDRRFYEVITAAPGKTEPFNYLLPPIDKTRLDENAVAFFKRKKAIAERALQGAFLGDKIRAGELEKEIKYIDEVLKDAQG